MNAAAPDPFERPLCGARVALRPLRESDCEAFLSGVARSSQLHGTWTSPPRDAAEFAAHLARRGASFLPLGVFRVADGAIAGAYDLSEIVLGRFCSAYLGYYAFAPLAGQGLMREGLELVLQLAFERLGLHRLEANIQPDNLASIALVRRAGFQREGYSPGYLFIDGAWRDHERWAIRREQAQTFRDKIVP